MRRLMNEILEYSRITTQGRRLEPVALRAAVDRALENVRASIEERGAEIRIAPLPVVMGDSVQLTQLFQNLIGNAIKYNRSEPPAVDIGARFDAQDGLWTIAVADNGIGIDPRYHERIFGIFTRLHTRVEYSGTGIGLALCRRIVERHGGRIWVDSVEGSGATFSFTLEPGNREVG
jgi:light-regulated signal transduction histidine kinase (bacteriophytochrome)